jgi:type 1 glutamine amidotransferase
MKTFLLALLTLAVSATAADKIKVLIVDGQNNHKWRETTPVLKQILEETGLFTVDVSTSPEKGKGIESWQPKFSNYAVVVSNYNGELWSPAMQEAFEKYVSGGGGFVPVHAANNAFPEWKAYNDMIGVGGWGGRSEKSGPYLRWRDGKWTMDTSAGRGGSHGKQHEFVLNNRAPSHPIMQGLPAAFMHRQDELYDRLRGPAKDVTVLASAMSKPETGGSGEEEPLLLAIPYGKGRVFHTALGHGDEAVHCVAFATTLQRGVEWAATGNVAQKVPASFPDDKESKPRP